MRTTSDKAEIHGFLRQDPVHGAYATGDLEPAYFAACTWYLAGTQGAAQALALIYRDLDPPVLLTLGSMDGVEAIFGQAPMPGRIYMSGQIEHLPSFLARYDFRADRVRPMLRMAVTAGSFRPFARPGAPGLVLRRLGVADAAALSRLYGQGGPHLPDAYDPAQLAGGIFTALARESDGELVAVAGTHLVAPHWGVAAVGNVYTHPGYRGRGYGRAVTGAVTAELLGRGLQVVLNVERDNQAALHLYTKLGYHVHGPYYEGIGVRKT